MQIGDAHREFQGVRAREAPHVRSRHRFAGDRWPTVEHALRHPRRFHLRVPDLLTVLHGAARALTSKELVHTAQLEAQEVLHLLVTFVVLASEVLVHTIPAPRSEAPHREHTSASHGRGTESAEAQRPFRVIGRRFHGAAHVRTDPAPQVHAILVLVHLQLGGFRLGSGLQVQPPLQEGLAQRTLGCHEPSLEDLLAHLVHDVTATKRDLACTARTLTVTCALHDAHLETGLVQLLSRPARLHRLDLGALLPQLLGASRVHVVPFIPLRRVLGQDLLLVENVEEPGVVVLVHGLPPLPALAPRACGGVWEARERTEDPRHESPADLQALQDLPVPHIAPHQDHKVLLHLLRVPGHLHAR